MSETDEVDLADVLDKASEEDIELIRKFLWQRKRKLECSVDTERCDDTFKTMVFGLK